ncbi:MAG: response regulator [Candidatus Omnitrophica bacterium]|nr:response regulator [Candidatus Omnitrophota bacterium]
MAQILIIEDDTDFRDILKELMEYQNYDVIVASDGDEGFKMFLDNPTPLVITDIFMPNREGMDLIFKFEQDFPDTKIIVISGGGVVAGDYLKAASMVPNVKAAFEKPFDMDELLQAVKEVL